MHCVRLPPTPAAASPFGTLSPRPHRLQGASTRFTMPVSSFFAGPPARLASCATAPRQHAGRNVEERQEASGALQRGSAAAGPLLPPPPPLAPFQLLPAPAPAAAQFPASRSYLWDRSSAGGTTVLDLQVSWMPARVLWGRLLWPTLLVHAAACPPPSSTEHAAAVLPGA